jgi:hypothetical protein
MLLDGFACWRRQPVQIHEGRCVAVDMVLLDAVSEKTLHSIRDLSMVVFVPAGVVARARSRSCRIRYVVGDFHASRQAVWGSSKGPIA